MALDGVKNFAIVTVSTGYDDVDTSIVLETGDGAKLPDPATANFNLVWWDSTNYSEPALDPNVEIVRCTAKSTDTLTVTRAQESTSGSTKNTVAATYKMALTVTAKMITDIGTDLDAKVTKALFDANTILAANSDNTPAAVTIAEQKVLGRATGGNITALDIDSDLSSVSANDDTIPSAKATKSALDGKKADSVSAASRILGRKTSGAGAIEELTLSEVMDFIGSAASGDILYRGASAWARLPKGTDGQILKLVSGLPSWANEGGAVTKFGLATRSGNASSGDQTIAHGLGRIPTIVKITAMKDAGNNGGISISKGIFDSAVVKSMSTTAILSVTTSSTYILQIIDYGDGDKQEATISVDSTNITLSWTKTGNPSSSTMSLLWEVTG